METMGPKKVMSRKHEKSDPQNDYIPKTNGKSCFKQVGYRKQMENPVSVVP